MSLFQRGPKTFSIVRNGNRRFVDLRGLYAGAACFVTASGPSLKTMPIHLLKQPGIITWGTNNSPGPIQKPIIRPNLWASVDTPARFLESVWRDPTILKFVSKNTHNDRIVRKLAGTPEKPEWIYSGPKVQECPGVIHVAGNTDFNPSTFFTEDTVNWGHNKEQGGGRTVFQFSIKIMFLLGFSRIYLCGVDFHMTGSITYAFDEQRSPQAVKNNECTYRRTLACMSALAPQMKSLNFSIYQCTSGSGLTIFPFVPLEEAVRRELSAMPQREDTWGRYLPNEPEKIKVQDRLELERRQNAGNS